MLVLTRKTDERIQIGTDITITVIEVKGTDKVRLGIDAPQSLSVHRMEVWEAIQADIADRKRRGLDP